MTFRYHHLNSYDHVAKMIYHECLNIMFDMLMMMIDFSVSCINFLKCNVNEFVHWNYNDAQIRMITYLCHDLEIDVKGFSRPIRPLNHHGLEGLDQPWCLVKSTPSLQVESDLMIYPRGTRPSIPCPQVTGDISMS